MKALRWLVVLLFVLALVAGAYLLIPRKSKTPAGAAVLAPDTFLFLQSPSIPRAKQEFKTTSVYRIWRETEVQEFLGKGVEALREGFKEKAGDNSYLDLSRQGMALAEGEIFLAIPVLEGLKQIPPIVVGMDVKQRRAEADAWLAKLKVQFQKDGLEIEEGSGTQDGVAFTRWTAEGRVVCHGYFGTLLVFTTDEQTMKEAIERWKNPRTPSLAQDSRYQNAVKRLPASYAALVYSNPQPLLAMLKGVALLMPQLQTGLKNMEAIRAISYSMTMANGSFQDVFFVDAPADKRGDMGKESLPTARKTLPLTSDTTLLYTVQSLDLSKVWDTFYQQLQQAPVSDLQKFLFQIEKFNRANGLNLPKDLLDSLGPEYAFAMQWDDGAQLPDVFFALEVRDRAKASAGLDKLWDLGKNFTTNSYSPEAVRNLMAETKHGKETIHTVKVDGYPVSPSYVVSDRFFLLSLHAETAKSLLAKHDNAGKTLADNAMYQQAMQSLPKDGHSYLFLDTARLFERVYGFAAPLARQHAGGRAEVRQYLDLNKLPQAKTIAQHLKPAVATQVVDKDGFTTVIISPVGTPFLVVGAAQAAVLSYMVYRPNFPL